MSGNLTWSLSVFRMFTHFKVYNLVTFTLYSVVQPFSVPISRTFHLLKQKLCTHLISSNPPSHTAFGNLYFTFCLNKFVSSRLHISGIIQYSLCLACSTQHNALQVHPYCSMYQVVHSFLRLDNIVCIYYILFIHLLIDIRVFTPFGYCE